MSQGYTFCCASKLREGCVPGRYGLNTDGIVGSLYATRTDNLQTNLSVDEGFFCRKYFTEKPFIKLRKVYNLTHTNLMKMIGIEDDLRVSIALDMVRFKAGIRMLSNHTLSTDSTTRSIDYQHIEQ
ncbi:unnamed protein product [Rotaria socialis]|uniref:Uncharacterized protein n=1 Tax=Rotaria socialis TaxID=392032 RepID=A0A820R3Y6_9BILA|nr:unnamed protein product [Rotaria socialis]CAF3455449.1 unnamed protein product [Rotaria socialis]CAF3472268.1 unnamed protein product [Rotaria socialis]CAF4185488.1 unnamed protein product [Rotaria socialis]CAF4432622.1 unnamed protein product [Rotaria socialis]